MASIADIRSNVRAIINEYVDVDDQFTLENNTILDKLIEQSVKEVVSIAPSYYCNTHTISTRRTKVRPDGRKVVIFSITDDMVKPVQISSTYLMRPIFEFLPTSDASYPAQYCRSKGVGAGAEKPVAYLTGSTEIEAHSISGDIDDSNGTVASLLYVPIPHICDGNINIPSIIIPAVCTKAAQMVLEAENSPSSALIAQRYNTIVSSWQEE